MKHIFLSSLMLLGASAVMAQETYENATIADKDLNGTARYVGMGGAMEALGADISTINSNPAGLGLFRSSQVTFSAGVQSVPETSKLGKENTVVSFDQLGIVGTLRQGENSFLNLAFNYHKSKNFNQILQASNRLSGASQNKLSYVKGYEGVFYPDFDKNDNIIGWVDAESDYTSNMFSQTDYLYYNQFLYDPQEDQFFYEDATGFDTEHATHGYIADYDFAVSGNINNRVYLGLTLGVQDVHYTSDSRYTENLQYRNSVTLSDYRRITGYGFNVKFGGIFRPVETSPFRIGIYAHTPTFYKLTTENTTTLSVASGRSFSVGEAYDFCLNTPWKFGASLGHTIGANVALGATYEYSDYGSLDTRVIDGGYYDYNGYWQDDSSSDYNMNQHTKMALKGVHTLKLGAEVKVAPTASVRVGYNYLSPKFDSENAFKDGTIDSYGTFYASQTDYTNWKDTHRFTCGFGMSFGSFTADLAYQYSTTKGEYFPFMSYYNDDDPSLSNICDKTDVSDNRHHVMFTLGYRF